MPKAFPIPAHEYVQFMPQNGLYDRFDAVLTPSQLHELGEALDTIHARFSPAYGPAAGNMGRYAMDVELEFDGAPGEVAKLAVKQARPYPGRDP